MNDISEKRPTFFEGQYLGAEDLEQLVTWMRDQSARHNLGEHAWGVAAGLALVEQSAPSGSLEVYLLPGYAIDGYGRGVLVTNPFRITEDLLAGQASGSVRVWLRYDEGGTSGVRPGFEVCAGTTDNYSRVAESWALEVGDLPVVDRQSGVTVSGYAVSDAREEPRVFVDDAPIACDASVPHQELPRPAEQDRWLIPLGVVGWQSGAPGKLVALTDDQRLLSRRLRRHLGVVAETLLAPGGVIRLRDRYATPPAGVTAEDQCAADDIQELDLQMCGGRPKFNELIWLEGDVRFRGDARLFGTQLELHDAVGTPFIPAGGQAASTPLVIRRNDENTRKGQDMQLLLGKSADGRNRLVVGQVTAVPDPANACRASLTALSEKVVVQDDGKVGVGTGTPDTDRLVTLEGPDNAYLVARTAGGAHELLIGADENGAIVSATSNDDLILRSGGDQDRIFVKADGKVGVGTDDPDRDVTIEHEGNAYLNVRTPDGEHEVLIGADNSGTMISAMSDDDLHLRSGGNVNRVNIKANGDVGVGTNSPYTRLTVDGSIGFTNGTEPALFLWESGSSNPERMIVAHTPNRADWGLSWVDSGDKMEFKAGGTPKVTVDLPNGRVGIGTTSPGQLLDVRGSIALGSSGQLFATSSPTNARMIAGTVAENGNVLTGDGFTVINQIVLPLGHNYRVNFNTAFDTPPIVVVTPVIGNGSGHDTTFAVTNNDTDHFVVEFHAGGGGFGVHRNFNFIAFGAR